jgi:L-alanine-DL-glutamate epimerase-like enolase superfamily enzyme
VSIVEVEPIVVALPWSPAGAPSGFGGRAWTTLDYLLVRVVTDDGLVGWGEGFGYNAIPATRAALETMVAPLLIGEDESDIETIRIRLERALHLFGGSGPVRFALAAIDIALWDLRGKRSGRPVHELLGSGSQAGISAYASAMPLGDPEVIRDEVEKAQGAGFRGFKLHETATQCVLAARAAADPSTALMLDVNCAWNPGEAAAAAAELVEAQLTWLEEPLWPPGDFDALAALRATTMIPIAAGENTSTVTETDALISSGGCDVFQPSVTKVGLSASSESTRTAVAAGIAVAPHSPYLGPGLLATLHLGAAHSQIEWIEHLWADTPVQLFPDGIGRPVDGVFRVPEAPGLGADPVPSVLDAHRVA